MEATKTMTPEDGAEIARLAKEVVCCFIEEGAEDALKPRLTFRLIQLIRDEKERSRAMASTLSPFTGRLVADMHDVEGTPCLRMEEHINVMGANIKKDEATVFMTPEQVVQLANALNDYIAAKVAEAAREEVAA